MAITQVSKIQVRRGVRGDADVPVLDPGELGWAVDTHELFIGNDRRYDYFYDQQSYDGTSYEPFVPGAEYNTRILTTHDFNKITEQAKYQFSGQSSHVVLTLQQKLEQEIYIEEFGVNRDLTDNTRDFRQAVLKIGPDRILHLQPGVYNILYTVDIPSNVKIKGSGRGLTFIKSPTKVFNVGNDVSITDLTIVSDSDAVSVRGNNVSLNIDFESSANVGSAIVVENGTNLKFNGSVTGYSAAISATATLDKLSVAAKLSGCDYAIDSNVVMINSSVDFYGNGHVNAIDGGNNRVKYEVVDTTGNLQFDGVYSYYNHDERGQFVIKNGQLWESEYTISSILSDTQLSVSTNWSSTSPISLSFKSF